MDICFFSASSRDCGRFRRVNSFSTFGPLTSAFSVKIVRDRHDLLTPQILEFTTHCRSLAIDYVWCRSHVSLELLIWKQPEIAQATSLTWFESTFLPQFSPITCALGMILEADKGWRRTPQCLSRKRNSRAVAMYLVVLLSLYASSALAQLPCPIPPSYERPSESTGIIG